MKSIITYLGSILFIISSNTSFGQAQADSNSPGEKSYVQGNNSSLEVLEANYLQLLNDVEIKNDRIQSLYFIQQEVLDSYGGGTQIITKSLKRNIFKAGQRLIKVQNQKISKSQLDDFAKKIQYLKEIERIQDQLIYFSGIEDTRQTEKELRKLKKADEIEPVFFQRDSK